MSDVIPFVEVTSDVVVVATAVAEEEDEEDELVAAETTTAIAAVAEGAETSLALTSCWCWCCWETSPATFSAFVVAICDAVIIGVNVAIALEEEVENGAG